MRVLAARSLHDRSSPRTSQLLVEHLEGTIAEADRGLADAGALIEAVSALGPSGPARQPCV